MKKDKKNYLLAILSLCFFGFVILSWWLLFRDQRALKGFESLYPFLSGSLFSIRATLLNYSLNVLPTFLFLVMAITSFIAYYLSLKQKYSVNKVIIWSVIFQVIIFFSYPVLSTDIFSYTFSSRVATQHSQNKWLVTPDNFPDDHFEQFADWKDKTNVYGYVNHIVYLPADYFGLDDVFTTVLLYKLTAAIFSLATIYLLFNLLQKESANKKEYYLKLILWNPLFLLELLGSGHNDILLIFFVLLSLILWNKKNWIMAGIVLAFSVQVKLIAVIFFGFFAVKLFQEKKFVDLFKYSFSFLIVNILSFTLMQISPLTFIQRVFLNTHSYWQSLPGLVVNFTNISVSFTLLFAIIGLLIVSLQLKYKFSPIYSSAISILFYLLFFTAAYWNWYVLWVFVFIPFIKNSNLKNSIILFTFTSLLAYPLLWFSHRFGFGNPVWEPIQYIWIFVVPISYYLYNQLLKK